MPPSVLQAASPPASQSPADLRASGASRQGPGQGDADCGSSSVHQLLELALLKRVNQLQWILTNTDTIVAEESVLI